MDTGAQVPCTVIFSQFSAFGDAVGGIGFYQLIADLVEHFEEKKDALRAKLQELTGGRYPVVSVSAKEQTGLSKLTEQIHSLFYQGEISVQDELYITNARQKHALWDAAEGLQRVQESISLGMPEDFYSIDLLAAYEALGTITGETVAKIS